VPRCSAVEHRPAEVVSQPLVVEHERANLRCKLIALPPALESSRTPALRLWRCRAGGPDGIGGRTELVRRDVCDTRGLAGGVRGMSRRPAQRSGSPVCMAAGRPRFGHRDFAVRPGPSELDRSTRAVVSGAGLLEVAQHMFGACRGPQGEQLMIRVGQSATAPDRHQPGVADLREDHTQQIAPTRAVDRPAGQLVGSTLGRRCS